MINEHSLEDLVFYGELATIIAKINVVSNHISLELNDNGGDNGPIYGGWQIILADVMDDLRTINKVLEDDWEKKKAKRLKASNKATGGQ